MYIHAIRSAAGLFEGSRYACFAFSGLVVAIVATLLFFAFEGSDWNN
jgi:hypothetical protein